jgi:hypothetical protein
VGRRYSKISGVTLVSCDAAGAHLPEHGEFRSASIPKVIAEQLQLAGWSITEAPTGRWISVGRGRIQEMRTVYLCPDHKPKPRMDGGPPLISTMGRTSH